MKTNSARARDLEREEATHASHLTTLLQVIADLQLQTVTELRGLRNDLQTQSRRPVRRHLLSVIAASVQGTVFSAAEVLLHAETDPALAAALDLARIRTAKELGSYLLSLESKNLDGLRLVRVGKDRDGVLWQIGS